MLSRDALLDCLPRLRRYARALTGDVFAADDLVQDTLERALSRWALLRPGSQPMVWLLAIMHNVAVNGHRAGARRLEQITDDGTLPEPGLPPTQGDGLAYGDLLRCIERLPEEQRSVLLLVCVEELSYAQCAKVLGVPQGTVMSRLSRGRERLARLLAGDEEGASVSAVAPVKLEIVK